jgi:CRISPR-associated protein, NE0113 family
MASSSVQTDVQAESKGNHWLVCVAGSSPAVVTETLYCLKERANFPNKVVIFTTLHGQEAIQKKGMIDQIANLCRDYNLPLLTEEQVELRIITGTQGEQLWDIRTSEEQETMANFLTQEIRSITHPQGKHSKRPDTIHASLAGGRKSMSFYMGNIFSFFASPQDELSHVLVHEDYEVPGFWYPTPESKLLDKKDWKTGETKQMDAKEAQLELSSIPFVRLSNSLVSTDSPAFHQLTYRQLVDIYQVTLDPAQISLTFDLKNFRVDLNGRVLPITHFDSYLLYYLIAKDSQEGALSFQKELYGDGKHALTQALWQLMGQVIGIDDFSKRFNDNNAVQQPYDLIKNYLDERNKNPGSSAVVTQHGKLFEAVSKGVISEKVIERMMTDIRKALGQTEGKATVEYCKIVTLKEDEGQRKTAKGVDAYLGLLLPAEQIHFIS